MHVSAFETRDNPQSDVLVAEGRFLWWGGRGGGLPHGKVRGFSLENLN